MQFLEKLWENINISNLKQGEMEGIISYQNQTIIQQNVLEIY